MPSELDNLAASQFQHLVAFRVRRHIARSGRTMKEIADERGVQAAWLGRVLRGETVMALRDVVWADAEFRLGLLPATAG
jgi:hypothetical protein